MKAIFIFINLLVSLVFSLASATDLKVGDTAPSFKAKLQNGQQFDLRSRRGAWTVLYFYPKAATPGCTKQAVTFRDNIEKIRALDADVYGVSVDSVADQKKFHSDQNLNFNLIADEDGDIVKAYGSKMPILNMSKRWTFILDPELKIRHIENDVDPVSDTEKMPAILAELKAKAQASKK